MWFSEKTMENVRNHGDIKLKTAEEGSNLISIRTKLSYNKKLSRQFISNRNERKTDTHEWLNYLALSILEISKIVMDEFWYEYLKPKYGEKQNYVTWIQTTLQCT